MQMITKPFVGMMIVQVAQAGLWIVAKQAMLTGMTNFTFVFYSNIVPSIILLPSALFIHRSRPPLTFPLLGGLFLFGFIGCLVQLVGYAAYQYCPASFGSAMLNLIPGFTFTLAIIFGMEKVERGASTTVAKFIGITVSIIGAFIATLYQGPSLLGSPSNSSLVGQYLGVPETNLLLGGSLYLLDCILAAMFIIVQTIIVKKYPAELIILFFYCFFIAIVSAILSFILEGDQSSWSLQPISRLWIVLYSGIFGSAFQIGIGLWCLSRIGPFFLAMFQPLGIAVAAIVGILFLGDPFYLGTLLGSIIIILGFYCVMWGKAKEANIGGNKEVESLDATEEITPLLQNNV